MTGSLAFDVSYGMDVDSINYPAIETAEKAVQCMLEIVSTGSFLGMSRWSIQLRVLPLNSQKCS